MISISDRAPRTTSAKRIWARLAAFAVLLTFVAGGMAAHAADTLDREVSFTITPASLASALVQFSLQSGVQVAVADSDVANVQSSGLTGTYPAHDALAQLLHGTGLEFSRVGASTVAIRSAAAATVVAKTESTAPAKAASAFPDVALISPRPPTPQELAGDSVYEFIVNHATTHYPKSQGTGGTLARWRGGRPETLCPTTMGLDPAYNTFVTARLRAIADAVGAPVQSDPHCKSNVWIFFTTQPEKLMGGVLKRATQSLGVKFLHDTDRELQVSGMHAVQGWYLTSGGGAGILNKDANMIGPVNLLALWPYAIPTGLHSIDGLGGIVMTILVIDTAKVAGYTIGSIADYVAMATLSVVQSPDHCDPLPSILDLMAPSCSGREKPAGITAGDMAFLKALYFHNTGIGPTLSRDDIQLNMMRQFKGQ
jgi:Secretin and TonB N terminus short domain